MAKIRIARKSSIYAALSVFTALFLAAGIFFVYHKLKTDYLSGPAVRRAPALPAPDAGASEPDAGAGEPDAGAGEPDAGAGGSDAGAGEPDARAGEPDDPGDAP